MDGEGEERERKTRRFNFKMKGKECKGQGGSRSPNQLPFRRQPGMCSAFVELFPGIISTHSKSPVRQVAVFRSVLRMGKAKAEATE